MRRRNWYLAAAITCAVALAALFVAFGLARRQRLADAEALCPHLQTNSVRDRRFFPKGLPPTRKFWEGETRGREVTVRETLIELGAGLRGGKVVDRQGRELYFYWVDTPHSPKPNPQRTDEEIAALAQQGFRVIRMYDDSPWRRR